MRTEVEVEVKVTALVCPRCGKGLDGLRYDRLFTCAPCATALLVEDGATREFPFTRARAAAGSAPEGRLLWMPLWELETEVTVGEPRGRAAPLVGVAAAMERVWVAGFAVRRPELFGEPGAHLTEIGARLEPAAEDGEPARLVGCCRGPDLIARYARLTVLRILDRRVDVTGIDIDVRMHRCGLWAVPFDDRGERLVDRATGASLPAAAFEDLAEIRAATRRPSGTS